MLADVLIDTARSLRAHALRFTLTSLGIVWGIFTLTYLQATTDGFDVHYHRMITKIGSRLVVIFPGVVLKERVGERGARDVELELEDLARLERLEAIESSTPNLWTGTRVLRGGDRTKVAFVFGVSEQADEIRNYEIGQGRFISSSDVARAERVAFLGSVVAERVFGRAPPVGRTLHIDSIPFRVIGVSRPKGEQIVNFGPNDDEQVLVPVTSAQRWFTLDDKVKEVLLRPRTARESWNAIELVRTLLGLHHGFDPGLDTALSFFNLEEVLGIVRQLGLGLKIFFLATSIVTLAVGAIGVMNIMLVVVGERTREIGLRKAIGASNGAIFVQFLAEAVAITGLSGLAGGLLGWGLVAYRASLVPTSEYGVQLTSAPLLLPGTILAIAGTLSGVGLLAGLLPALRAMRVEPAIALRQL
jgi:putative ABC transport system permease protein